MPLYFDGSKLPGAKNEYVAWLDVMGIQSAMARSLAITSNFVFKFHAAALLAQRTNIKLYPVMDGVYVSSDDQSAIQEFLRSIFPAVAEEFNDEREPLHRFMIRGAMAYGPVVHGADLPAEVGNAFQTTDGTTYKTSILLGMPMAQAHQCERLAPPFGLFVHESARAFSPPGTIPLRYVWWKWDHGKSQAIWNALKTKLAEHLDWCSKRPTLLLYDLERIKVHKALVDEYFV